MAVLASHRFSGRPKDPAAWVGKLPALMAKKECRRLEPR